ncbi:hypothetical protein [Ralstonia sp. 25mfcol4.1]|uniref:hypothetical protein n=1 Tax=Ralstonia sp. 25mfcol4.1 TaxID=1761899 RepID=UPI00111467EC|nr:hypothetical protein [Ralstonia sp. 25mfcol4.1]
MKIAQGKPPNNKRQLFHDSPADALDRAHTHTPLGTPAPIVYRSLRGHRVLWHADTPPLTLTSRRTRQQLGEIRKTMSPGKKRFKGAVILPIAAWRCSTLLLRSKSLVIIQI